MEEGLETTKFRPCHDLFFSPRGIENLSINTRHLDEELHAIQYAHTIWRIVHFIVALYYKHPSTPILIMKFDVYVAFKRLILKFSSALRTITILGSLAFISLYSTFGDKSSCSNFSLIAEPMADLMNEVLNTNHLQALHSTSNYIQYHDPPILLDSNIPFTPADEPLFEIPTLNNKLIDLYVDYFIGIYLDLV